jgi:hypothetical protein
MVNSKKNNENPVNQVISVLKNVWKGKENAERRPLTFPLFTRVGKVRK